MSKESRAEYYMKAFEKLENEGKHTWNWAAFFFPGSWMIYRKMYLYFFCLLIAGSVIGNIISAIGFGLIYLCNGSVLMEPKTLIYVILFNCIIMWVIEGLCCGYYGNALYRRAIRTKISKGYHKLEHFCPTSLASMLLSICPCGFLVILPIMFADWIQKKREHIDENKLEAQDKMLTKENIEIYLNPRKKKSGIMYAAISVSTLLCVLSWLFVVAFIGISMFVAEHRNDSNFSEKIESIIGKTIDYNRFQSK